MDRKVLSQRAIKLLLAAAAVVTIAPLLWLLLASLSTDSRVGLSPTGFLGGFHVTNYVHAFTDSQFGSFFVNSVLISAIGSVLLSATAACTAYALAKLRFRGKGLVFLLVMVGVVIPVYGYFLQLAEVVQSLHLYNTRTADVLAEVAVNSPVPILVMFAFYQSIPGELTEAARVDGAEEFTVFSRIVLPLARPALVLCLVFGFVWIWSDLFIPEVLLVSPSKYTIPAGINFLIVSINQVPPYVILFAATVMSTIPMMIVYKYLSRHSGDLITGGALKG